MLKKGRAAILEQFLTDGILYMFGNPGTVEQGFLDALRGYQDFKYIMTLQESIAVGIADGYARKTKTPALVQLHSGVGLGNGIGMMYQAMRGHAPLIVLAGESGLRYDAMDAQMAADLVGMAKPVTKWAARVVDHRSVLRNLRRAVKIASTPPMGPVFLCLPMDILDEECCEPVVPTTRLNTKVCPDEVALSEAAEILLGSDAPMIVMGDGIACSGAQDELAELAGLIGAEVWGADSSEVNIAASKPNYKGSLGHMFGYQSQPIISLADAVLITGTYILPEVFPVLEGVFNKKARIIHIDLDGYEIAKNFPVDIGIVSDPKTTLARLIEIVKSSVNTRQKTKCDARQKKLEREKDDAQRKLVEIDKKLMREIPMHPARFMQALSKNIPEDTVIFDEALTCSPELNRYFPPVRPGHFFQTRGGSLGVGIPGAIGLKLADPDRTVVGLTGDGGSMYTIQALWTAAHHNIGAKFIVCNNHSYRLLKLNITAYWKEREIQEHEFPKMFDIKDPDIDFANLSRSLGVPALKIEKPEGIEPGIKQMVETDGPFLLDLLVQTEDDIS